MPTRDQPEEASLEDQKLLVQRLFVKYQIQIRAFAIGLTGDFTAAEDVIQEAFLTITKKAADFQPGSEFLSWALTITRLKVYENTRATRRFSKEVLESLAASLPLREMRPDIMADDRIAPLLECIEELPPKAREVMRLRYFAEHVPAEIAAVLGRTVAGVNATLVKSRESLRECVAKKMAIQG
jgi:RNA polymerase sigma-70 factor (ECF subfamily)